MEGVFMLYREVWVETQKAFNYLYKKGFSFFSDSMQFSSDSPEHIIIYTFSDVTEKARKHVEKCYPLAKIVYSDSKSVNDEINYRYNAFKKYQESL